MCVVENNRWRRPALNPCILKGHGTNSTEMNDRLSVLPNELVLLILSFLTSEEVKRTSVISKKWRRWFLGYYPKLNFERSRGSEIFWYEIRNNDEELAKVRSSFIRWVDHVMKQHLDSSIDEFRVAFDLDSSCQSHIDNWVDFALTKRVKTVELDFRPVFNRLDSELHRCGLSINHCKPLGLNHSLASLCLNSVNITSEAVESILLSCPFLEKLCIEKSEFLTSLKSCAPLVSLKHLDVSCCNNLQTIDISAPKMVIFRYFGQPTELNIRDAFLLSSLFIGVRISEEIAYAFEAMSKYFPQLEVLHLQISLGVLTSPCNIGVGHLNLPLLTTLKVLDLYIEGQHSSSLLGWAPLIEACPVLQKLTVKFDCYDTGVDWFITKRNGSPLKSLKTMEISGYCGRRIDIEFAAFVFENAINLQQVIVEVNIPYRVIPDAPYRISELKEFVPPGVSFIMI